MYNLTQIVYNFTQVVYFFYTTVGRFICFTVLCKLFKQWSNSVCRVTSWWYFRIYEDCPLSSWSFSALSCNKQSISPAWFIFRHPKDVSYGAQLTLPYSVDKRLSVCHLMHMYILHLNFWSTVDSMTCSN